MFYSKTKKIDYESKKAFFQLLETKQNTGSKVVLLYGATTISGFLGHLVVLEVLQKSKFKADAIYGSQFGALFGYLYNYRISYRLLRSYLYFLNWKEVFDFKFKKLFFAFFSRKTGIKQGLISGKYFSKLLENLTNVARKSITENSYVCVERLIENRLDFFKFREYFTDVDLLKASMAFSGIFPPVELNKYYYTDSGVTGSLPLKEIIENEIKINPDVCKKGLVIVAFHEGFLQNYFELTLTERLLYSLHEKIRYMTSERSLNITKNKGVQLYLFSYLPFNIKQENIFKLSRELRQVHIDNLMDNLSMQFMYYIKESQKSNVPCTIYPFVF